MLLESWGLELLLYEPRASLLESWGLELVAV